MKKLIALVLALICVLSLAGCQKTSASCQKTISASEVYLFPEPTILITGSFYSQGKETTFEIGSENYGPNDFISWFYDLELTACDEPEAVEGAESYTFVSHVSGGGREPSWGGVRQRNLEGNQEQIPGEKAHRFH